MSFIEQPRIPAPRWEDESNWEAQPCVTEPGWTNGDIIAMLTFQLLESSEDAASVQENLNHLSQYMCANATHIAPIPTRPARHPGELRLAS